MYFVLVTTFSGFKKILHLKWETVSGLKYTDARHVNQSRLNFNDATKWNFMYDNPSNRQIRTLIAKGTDEKPCQDPMCRFEILGTLVLLKQDFVDWFFSRKGAEQSYSHLSELRASKYTVANEE